VSFPELTPYVRYFKLMGYTLGVRQTIPLAVTAQASITRTQKNTGVVGQDENGNNIVGDVKARSQAVFAEIKADALKTVELHPNLTRELRRILTHPG